MEATQRGRMMFFVGPDGAELQHNKLCLALRASIAVKQSVRIASGYVTPERLKLLFAISGSMLLLTKDGRHSWIYLTPATHSCYSGEEILPNAQGAYSFPVDVPGPYLVLPEEALQHVPSDEEDDDEDAGAHSHGHAHHAHGHHTDEEQARIQAEMQATLRERLKRMEQGRKRLIKELYIPRHPHLYSLVPEVRIRFVLLWSLSFCSESLLQNLLRPRKQCVSNSMSRSLICSSHQIYHHNNREQKRLSCKL